MHLTLNNHFKYDDILNVKYGRCNREPLNFRSECVETAKLIKTDPINIFFSGGIDSEIVCRSFLEAEVPFICIICEFEGGYNSHDIKYAFDFCKKHNIKTKTIKIDVKRFWKYNLYRNSTETKCISPQFPVIMWMVSQVNGFNILGSGECFLNREGDDWVMFEREKVATLYKHYDIHNIKGAPGFFQYTPELMLSFLENSIIENTVVYGGYEYDNSYPLKPKVYHDLWDMKARKKYNGFEKLKILDKRYRNILSKLYPNSNRIFKTEYNRLINILAPVVIKEVNRDFVDEYRDYFEQEKMSIENNPFDEDVDLVFYYAAFVREEVAGFGVLDIFKDRKSVYSHSSLTLIKFRGMGINNLLLNFRYDEIWRRFNNPDMQVIVITPNWISGGKYQEEKFLKKGFIHNQVKPKCSTTLTCKLKDIKYV